MPETGELMLAIQYGIVNEIKKNSKKIKRNAFLAGMLIFAVEYSVYVQATKIEKLQKEIEELKSQKGD